MKSAIVSLSKASGSGGFILALIIMLQCPRVFGGEAEDKIPAKQDDAAAPAAAAAASCYGLNVRDFGAKGDGKADDTAAIQKAFDEACSRPRGDQPAAKSPRLVIIPPGTYRVTATINLDHRHSNLAVVGIGGSRVNIGEGGPGVVGARNMLDREVAGSEIAYDGPKGGNLLECKGLSGLRMSDIVLNGQGKAGVLLRTNSVPGHGSGEYYIERTNIVDGRIGLEFGGDMDMCAADCTFIDVTISSMTEACFRANGGQQVDYVFIRPETQHSPIGFDFIAGGAATFTHPCFFRIDRAFKIGSEKAAPGINNGSFTIRGNFFERGSLADPEKRTILLDAQGECNVTLLGVTTGCQFVWGDKADLETPNFILGPSAQVSVIGCLISGRIARLTGSPKETATWIQFDNCRFRCASDPRKDISSDEWSGYEIRNCSVVADDTTGKDYVVKEKIMIPRLVKYPRQAEGQPGFIKQD